MSNPSIDLFHARLQIERLICSYADLLDAGHVEQVANLFERGKICIDGIDAVHHGSKAILDMFVKFTLFYDKDLQIANPTIVRARPWTKHLSSNLNFELLNGAEAILWSCFTVMQGLPGKKISPIVVGRYRDTFNCDNGEWYFVERMEYIDLVGDVSHHLKGVSLG
jgi:hypothetical protein